MFIGNGFVRREYVTRRKICVVAWVVTFFSIIFFTPRASANAAALSSGIFSPDADRINLYRTLDFEAPSRVIALLEAAKSEEEESVIWGNLPSGVYDEDIQLDLLDLIFSIFSTSP